MSLCKQCQQEFTGKRKDAEYCSSACGNNFRNQKQRKLKANNNREAHDLRRNQNG